MHGFVIMKFNSYNTMCISLHNTYTTPLYNHIHMYHTLYIQVSHIIATSVDTEDVHSLLADFLPADKVMDFNLI